MEATGASRLYAERETALHKRGDCLGCGALLEEIWREGEFSADLCPRCGLIFSETGGAATSYDDNYFYNMMRSERSRVKHFRRLLAGLSHPLQSPLLDVGAGLGHFLLALPPRLRPGATLVEPSGFARNHMERALGIEAYPDLESIPFDRIPFAAVTLWDVLAHVPDPRAMLTAIRLRMDPGGVLVVKTPHHPRRLFQAARSLGPIRKGRSLLHIPSMRTHFTPSSLQELLAASGFQPLSWQWVSETPLPPRAWFGKSALLHAARRIVLRHVSFSMLASPVS